MNILANLISLTILFAVPLLLVALGGMFSEHSGVINIALEGMMIIGALFSNIGNERLPLFYAVRKYTTKKHHASIEFEEIHGMMIIYFLPLFLLQALPF